MTDQQKKDLMDAIYEFAMRVLKGQGTKDEVDMLPNLLAVTHVMND